MCAVQKPRQRKGFLSQWENLKLSWLFLLVVMKKVEVLIPGRLQNRGVGVCGLRVSALTNKRGEH